VEYAVASAVLGAVAWLFLLNGVLGRFEGGILVLLYVAGVVWVWRREKEPPLIGEMAELDAKGELRPSRGTDEATGKALLMVLLGLLGMVAGGFLAVRGAEGLVDALGITESAIGLTVLALATSAEMVALVWAARRRGLTEVVVAGTVGAVAYNATVSLGTGALVSPLGLGRHNVIITVAGLTALLPLVLLVGLRSGTLPRPVGALLVLAYVATAGFLLAR
jgi:cation:H+ antiporter